MSINTQVISPAFVQTSTTSHCVFEQSEAANETTLKYTSSTENLSPQLSRPATANVKSTSTNLTVITLDAFYSLLNEASKEADPFVALTKHFVEKGGHWSLLFQLDKDRYVECQLAHDKWASTCFAKVQPGDFRYIDLYEHNPVTGTSDEKQLVSIRMAEDHKLGEWLWINRSKTITGREAISLGAKISRAMKIETCFLVDSAKVKSCDGVSEIAILAPLQIIQGHGYYAPLFTLVDTNKKSIDSPINIAGTNKNVSFCQNVKRHQKRLTWLRELKVNAIYTDILKDRPVDQKAFVSLLKRNTPALQKGKSANVIAHCNLSLQELMSQLYAKKGESKKNLLDYEWAYFRLLDTPQQTKNTPNQRKYKAICQKLFDSMLMKASFAAGL